VDEGVGVVPLGSVTDDTAWEAEFSPSDAHMSFSYDWCSADAKLALRY